MKMQMRWKSFKRVAVLVAAAGDPGSDFGQPLRRFRPLSYDSLRILAGRRESR